MKILPVDVEADLNDLVVYDGEFVTVELNNGQMYVGTLTVIDRDTITLATGLAGRNPIFWNGDIDDVRWADSSNEHISVTFPGSGSVGKSA